MQASLAALLDQVRGSRAVLPHLAALERALGAQGLSAIDACPQASLARICAQLASLPLPDGDIPLLALQTRLLRALGATAGVRATAPVAAGAAAATSVGAATTGVSDFHLPMRFDDSRMLSVDEASMTDFDAAMQAQRQP